MSMVQNTKYLRYVPWAGAVGVALLTFGTVSPTVEPIERLNLQAIAGAWPGFPTAQTPPLAVPESPSGTSSSLPGGTSSFPTTTGTDSSSSSLSGSSVSMPSSSSGGTPPPPPAPPSDATSGSAGSNTSFSLPDSPFAKTSYDATIGSSALGAYQEIPGLLQEGVGFSSVRLRKDYLTEEGECESFGAGYWLGWVIEEGVLGEQSRQGEAPLLKKYAPSYENPTYSRASYPSSSQDTTPTVGETKAGPTWTATCESLEGSGDGTYGNLMAPSGNISVEKAISETTSTTDQASLTMDSETYTALSELNLGPVSVGSMSSKLEVETDLKNSEPTVTYKVRIADVSNGAQQIVDSGQDGIVLAGKNVPSSDLHKHFNKEAAKHEEDLKQLGYVGLQVMAPRVEQEMGITNIVSAVVSVWNGVAAREGGIGDEQGVNLLEARYTNGATR